MNVRNVFALSPAILFIASCTCTPLPVCEVEKGKDRWDKVEACYEQNKATIEQYNATMN